MPSFVWDRDIEEAWIEPYEYDGQSQFFREASKVISALKEHYSKKDMSFDRDEESLEKAVWIIQVDALEAISDSLKLTEEKRHRIASRLFRDAVETMDISAYFYLAKDKSKKNLQKWYKDEVIPHRVFRTFIKEFESQDSAKNLGYLYRDLSKYTHRTYNAIYKSYMLGHDNKIAYDGFRESKNSVLPHVISFSYAIIAMLIKRFVEISENTGEISKPELWNIWEKSLEKESALRRFGNGSNQIMRGAPVKIEWEQDDC